MGQFFQFFSTLSQNVILQRNNVAHANFGQLPKLDFDNILLGDTPSKEPLCSMFDALFQGYYK